MKPDEAAWPPVTVLVTGAGGPAAGLGHQIAEPRPHGAVVAADMDAWAAGLYLLPPDRDAGPGR